MIGQKHLLEIIDKNLQREFPKFFIIQGNKGYGRKTICYHIAEKLGIGYNICDIKTEEVKNIITTAYLNKFPVLYIFPEADNMHANAKNALLKITEEPPRNSYFAMTIQDPQKLLATLLSRGTLFRLDEYSSKDIYDIIIKENPDLSNKEIEVLLNICHGPGDIHRLIDYGIIEFYDYCEQVLDNIGLVAGYNAFKIINKLKIKDTGWDLDLFLDTISYIALKRLQVDKEIDYMSVINLCSKYKQELKQNNYNRGFLMDDWILKMRQVLY